METLIYIDDKEKLDASAVANSFTRREIKNRAYINTLGAELALKYLKSENINISGIYNIHSIKKILEEIDISDIMLANIHIDVRVVFDENAVFIPKSHYEYDITPDIYIIFQMAQDNSYVKFLGFFEPKMINKNNENSDYYFIEKEKLNSPHDLIQYINSHKNNTDKGLSEEDIENSENIIVSMSDHDISENEKKYLIKQLTKSALLRDKFIEFENFETLSYKAMNDSSIHKPEKEIQSTILSTAALTGIAKETAGEVVEGISEEVEDLSEITEGITENIEGLEEINDIISDELSDDLVDLAGDPVDTDVAETEEFTETLDNISLENIELPEETSAYEDESVDNSEEMISVETLELDNIIEDEPIENLEETVSLEELTETSSENLDDNSDKIALDDTIQSEDVEIETSNNIDSIEDVISLETLDIPENIEEEKTESQEDVISLESIEESNENITLDNETELEPTISLDDMEPVENLVDNTELTENNDLVENNEETISFDNIETENDNSDIENLQSIEDVISLDDIEEESINENLPEEETVMDNFLDNTETFENSEERTDDEDILEENSEIVDTLEDNEHEEEILSNIDEVITSDEESETITLSTENKTVEEESETFGKNLIDNLSADNFDNIEIDINSDKNDAEDISSNDLLSQIDDVLNASSIAEIENNDDISIDEVDNVLQEMNIKTSDEISDDISEENSEKSSEDENIDSLLNVETDDELAVLYNDTDTDSDDDHIEELHEELHEEVQAVPGAAFLKNTTQKLNKKTIIAAAALITVLAGGAFMLFKPKANNTVDLEPLPVSNEPAINQPAASTNDILESNAPVSSKPAQQEVIKEIKNNPQKPISSNSYIDVKKLVWDGPDSVMYSSKIQNYLRTAGKSIKLSLSADLLLATEYAYTNNVKVGLELSKNGNVQNAKILSGSGSSQIDNIVLQSVKDTLNVIKPPSDAVTVPNFNLNLIIYF